MNFSILTIGDEICIGQIINTNAAWIAEKMSSIGLSALFHSSVPDNKELILSELKRLEEASDIVIVTGGLGPTHDDITKDTLLSYYDDEFVLHEDTLKYLENWFSSRNRIINEINKNQALLPSKCRPLKNLAGTAPGMLFEQNSKLLVSLPGVPAEMKYILEYEFLPIAIDYFEKNSKNVQLYLTIKTAGIFESALAELIGSPDNFPKGGTLAYLPSAGSVRLRIGGIADTKVNAQQILDEMKQIIIEKSGKYIVGYGNDSIQSLIASLLIERKLTVAVAESCTGGMLGASFTDLAGSSEYFLGGVIAYSNDIKIDILNVTWHTIEDFGAVSEQTALELSENVRLKFNSDFGISITGIAGPSGGTEDKPVGTVWIGISDTSMKKAKMYRFGNDRGLNRERAVATALLLLKERILEI
jgi:nicotinamide-nucleotide amidase